MAGRYKAYSEYKDSGVEWFNDLPASWRVVMINSVSSKITNGYVGPTRGLFLDEGIRYLQSLHIKQNKINFHTPYYVSKAWSDGKSKSVLKEGDVLIVQTGDIGQVAAVGSDFVGCNCHALIIVTPTLVDGFYLSWFLNSSFGFNNLKSIQTGALHPHLNCDAIKSVKVPLPTLPEQKQIAAFLDHETGKIDLLIEKQQALIALLKENRQAVISHAVTKGLNPEARMKDSGVEWLGDVPEHWEVSLLKHFVSSVNGFGFSSTDFCDEGVPFVRAGNIKNKSITKPKIHLPKKVVDNYKRVFLKSGDIVISMVGSDPKILDSAVGQVGIVPKSLENAVPNQNTVILREDGSHLKKKYLFYVLCSESYRNHLNVFSHKLANQSIISSGLILSAKFTFPNEKEQLEIVAHLDRALEKFDQVSAQCLKSLDLLQERRTALISAAVTGKIDVRDWTAPEEPVQKGEV